MTALQLATEAMARIDAHEKLCAWRWGILIRLLGSTLAAVLAVAGLMIYDLMKDKLF